MSKNPLNDLSNLGGYLRQQREAARLSVRQLAELAGVSNPYISQIERGLKRPSAEILQQLAKALQVSAESLYVEAGILSERRETPMTPSVREAVEADPGLTPRQREALLDIYASFVAANGAAGAQAATQDAPQTDDRDGASPDRTSNPSNTRSSQ